MYSWPSHKMGSSMSLLNMGEHAETHTHTPLSFFSITCLPLHSHVIRKAIDVRGSNFFPYSCGLLHLVVFWKGCLPIIVLIIRKKFLKRNEKYTFIFCLVGLKTSIKTLWRIVKSIHLHLMLKMENLYRFLSRWFWTELASFCGSWRLCISPDLLAPYT